MLCRRFLQSVVHAHVVNAVGYGRIDRVPCHRRRGMLSCQLLCAIVGVALLAVAVCVWVSPATASAQAPDGSGTMSAIDLTAISAGVSGNFVFVYFSASGGLTDGTLQLTVPAGWSAPQTADSQAAGYFSPGCGSAATIAGSGPWTVTISGVTMLGNGGCTSFYYDALAPSAPGTYTFAAEEASTSTGTLAPLSSSPTITVCAPDGSGTMTVSPSTIAPEVSGVAFSLTYTAANGGVDGGLLSLEVPTGWTPPQFSDAGAPGYVATDCGPLTDAIYQYGAGLLTVFIGPFTLAGGSSCAIGWDGVRLRGCSPPRLAPRREPQR